MGCKSCGELATRCEQDRKDTQPVCAQIIRERREPFSNAGLQKQLARGVTILAYNLALQDMVDLIERTDKVDAAEALRQLGASLDNGAVPFVLMGQLRWVAEKMPPQRVRPAIDAVFRTDIALKSSGGDPRTLLERLVVELCGAGSPVARTMARRR